MGAFPFVVFSSSRSSSFPFALTRDEKKKKESLSDAQRDEKEDDDKERGHHVQKHHLSISSSSSLRGKSTCSWYASSVVSRDFLFEEFRVACAQS